MLKRYVEFTNEKSHMQRHQDGAWVMLDEVADPIYELIHDMRTKPVADMDTVNGWIERLEKAIGDGNG